MLASLAFALVLSSAEPAVSMRFLCQSSKNAERVYSAVLVADAQVPNGLETTDASVTITPAKGFDQLAPIELDAVEVMRIMRNPETTNGGSFLLIASKKGGEKFGSPWRVFITIPSTVTDSDPIRATVNTLKRGAYPKFTRYTMTCENPQETGK